MKEIKKYLRESLKTTFALRTLRILCDFALKKTFKIHFLEIPLIKIVKNVLVLTITFILVSGIESYSWSLNNICFSTSKIDSIFPPFPEKTLHYHPEGNDFVTINGTQKFNRALYGRQTSFRVEAGDLPDFALYFPGIGGDMKLGVTTQQGTKWLDDFDTVETHYRAGTMLYRLKDSLLGHGEIHIQLLAMDKEDGMLVKVHVSRIKKPLQLIVVYGGASGIHPSRAGDLGAAPRSIFYLTPEHAIGNKFKVDKNTFELTFKDKKKFITLQGAMPFHADLHIGDANKLQSPEIAWRSASSASPILVCKSILKNKTPLYFVVQRKNETDQQLKYSDIPQIFFQTEEQRKKLAGRVRIQTPDPFLNTLGSTISIAADAIWKSPAYLHGAVAWRMWLNGWRGTFVADDLGWHDRAKTEFTAYNKMQLTYPDTVIPSPDPKYNLARQTEKIGVGIYNSGYISRSPKGKLVPHHYDMNLVYIDALMRHFLWTGDTTFLRQCWPVIKRHLAWENKNFDVDKNGLFGAYACIWASDALEYSGGDVAYSSAYNYFENKMAARFAAILGDDPAPYLTEAKKIRHAMNTILWIPHNGWYAEYKDRLGLQLSHPDAGLWSVYHAIDAGVANVFQSYQLLRYVDTHIPHIPIHCSGLKGKYFMLSTTDWMPYTWSVNNVAMAEMANTALAYWEGGRNEEAYKIFKSLILESMYLGPSPGNFEQLSAYDRYRGELYRDFSDPIGVCARALVEGLFGIHPDALTDTLTINPGFPKLWKHASVHLPDINYNFHSNGNTDYYFITPSFKKKMNLNLEVIAKRTGISKVIVNGKPVSWKSITNAVGKPGIQIAVPFNPEYHIEIHWNDQKPAAANFDSLTVMDGIFKINTGNANIIGVNDPQQALSDLKYDHHNVEGKVMRMQGEHTIFLHVRQGQMQW